MQLLIGVWINPSLWKTFDIKTEVEPMDVTFIHQTEMHASVYKSTGMTVFTAKTAMSINIWMDKLTAIYSYHGKL